jgi:hypothetical protein
MIRLIIFAPCEKFLQVAEGQTSMIGILEAVRVDTTGPIEADALTPLSWGFLTLWHRDEDVVNPIQYQERVELVRPDGVTSVTATADFEVNNSFSNFRQHGNFPVFPVGIPGKHILKLSLRESEKDWKEIATFPIMLMHNQTGTPNETSST